MQAKEMLKKERPIIKGEQDLVQVKKPWEMNS